MNSRAHLLSGNRRPLVAILADGSLGPGRDLIRGAANYANAHRQWDVFSVLRRLSEPPSSWPSCDGAIIGGTSADVFEAIRRRSKFLISCSGSTDSSLTPTVCLDDREVGRVAAEHLRECGLRSFSFYGVNGVPTSTNRAQGFKDEIVVKGGSYLECPFSFPGWGDPETNQPWQQLAAWLESLPKPVGIMAVDDRAAHYLAAACQHAEIDVPEQIAIIGVNNDDVLCEAASTPLSSVDGGFTRVGHAAAVMMDRLLKHEELTAEQKVIRLAPIGIVKRVSTDLLAVDDAHLSKAIRFIRQHACDPCSVAEVANAIILGRRDLERRFFQKLGRSPGEEILRVQMETATRLLLQPELSLEEVAKRCGFSCAPALTRAFKRTLHTSPSAYRRSAQSPLKL